MMILPWFRNVGSVWNVTQVPFSCCETNISQACLHMELVVFVVDFIIIVYVVVVIIVVIIIVVVVVVVDTFI